jgi:hypothetical protein
MSGGNFMQFRVNSKTTENDDNPVYAIAPFRINILSKSLGHQIGSYLLSPVAILISIIIIVSILVYRKRKMGGVNSPSEKNI